MRSALLILTGMAKNVHLSINVRKVTITMKKKEYVKGNINVSIIRNGTDFNVDVSKVII